jgi:hypothetical protein
MSDISAKELVTITGLTKCPADPYEAARWRQKLYVAAADGLRRAINDGLSPFLVRGAITEGMRDAAEDSIELEMYAALRFLLRKDLL